MLFVYIGLEVLCLSYTIHEVFSFDQNIPKFKIGIIGGGIGGTSTAFFLKNLKDAVLHLYEPENIGGRLQTSQQLKRNYEVGGAIIHPENQYMTNFVKEFGLKKKLSCPSKLGVFDGAHYAFLESSWNILNAFKMFWRYGLNIYWLMRDSNAMLQSFSKIYERQEKGEAFETVEGILASMNTEFPRLTKVSFRSYLKENKFNDLIIDELVNACTRTNYGQSTDIHAFVGSVSVAGASPNLWAVAGGNKRVPEELLRRSQATLLNRRVTKIGYMDSKFKVWSKSMDSLEESSEIYDAVAIAMPLTKDFSSIQFENFSQPFEFPGRYQRIICTMVEGSINATTFKFNDYGIEVDEILSDNASLYYNSVGNQVAVDAKDCQENEPKVYKVFSPLPLTEEQMSSLFTKYNHIEVKDWLAYPHYDPKESLGKIQLVPGLYYNNAIEKAASAMEMSVIAAKNSALLISKYLLGDSQNTKQTIYKNEL